MGSASECNTAWLNPSEAAHEIALLVADKDALSESRDAAMRELMGQEIALKREQYRLFYGTPVPPQEIARRVDEIKRASSDEKHAGVQSEAQSRINEQNRVLLVRERVRIGLGGRVDLTEMWSSDERYVLIQPSDPDKSILIDLEMKTRLVLPGTPRFLTPGGWYLYQPDLQVTEAVQLHTGLKWGPFEGDPDPDFLNDEYLQTRVHYKGPLGAPEYLFRIHSYQSGKHLDVGHHISRSLDGHRIAYFSDPETITVFDTQIWEPIRTIQTDRPMNSLIGKNAFFVYLKDGRAWYVRLSDLKEWDLGFGWPHSVASVDGNQAVIHGPKGIEIRNFESNLSRYLPTARYWALSKSRNEFSHNSFFKGAPNSIPETTFINLETLESETVDGEFSANSADGDFAVWYDFKSKMGRRHIFLNRRTGQRRIFNDMTFVDKVPGFPTFVSIDRGKQVNLWPGEGDPAQGAVAESLQIGTDRITWSPSGRYLITYDQEELVILEQQR